MDKLETLDLTHHAELSLNYLTGMTDAELGYVPYWRVNLEADPPEASHCRPDSSELPGSWVDAIVLARQMTGSKQGIEAEAGLKEMLLSDYGEDGLRYHASLPWCRVKHAVIHEQGYLLNGLVTWYMAAREPRVKETTERLIDRLLATAAHVGKSYTYELVETGTKSYYFPCDCIWYSPYQNQLGFRLNSTLFDNKEWPSTLLHGQISASRTALFFRIITISMFTFTD